LFEEKVSDYDIKNIKHLKNLTALGFDGVLVKILVYG